jgi:antitoxin ParD1/3/4
MTDNCYHAHVFSIPDGPPMPSSVDLGRSLEKAVNELVKAGRYNSRSEVLREGVRLVQEREARLASLDAAIARGVADADAGRITDANVVFGELAARYGSAPRATTKRKRRRRA